MSTIASPRDPSAPFPRRTNSSIITPTSSSRPSLDAPASTSGSPNPSTATSTNNPPTKRANRAALREYYNLRATTPNNNNNNKPLPSPPTVEITHPPSLSHQQPPSPSSELDTPSFEAPTYITHLLATSTLADLLRTYTRTLSEMRALDAEKKALVYDNYSKLIAATDTIRRMRAAQHRDAVAGGALEAVVERVYGMAVGLREGLRESLEGVGSQQEGGGAGAAAAAGAVEGRLQGGGDAATRRERTREVAREVVKVPGRVRRLAEEGRRDEARREWDVPRRLLVRWRELGVGGEDVGALIEEGDAALRGEGSKSEGDSEGSS